MKPLVPLSRREEDTLRALGAFDEPEFTSLSIDNTVKKSTEEFTEQTEDISTDRDSAIEYCRQDLNFIAAIAIPAIFKFLFPPVLVAAWALLKNEIAKTRVFPKIALGIPRSHAKTTLIKLFVLYCILFTDRKFMVIVGRTDKMADSIISDIIDMLEERNIINLFGYWGLELTLNQAGLKKFVFRGRTIILFGLGAGGSIRGANIKNERPDLIIFEDIQDSEDAKSEVISTALYSWMLGTAMKAKSPSGCMFIFVGNMFPGEHCILRKLKNDKTWIKFISGAILADGTALWEELRPFTDIIEELEGDMEAGHPEIFFSEVMNDTDTKVTGNFELGKIKPWPFKPDELCQGKMIIIDPSGGKKGNDPCTIGYLEIYDGRPGLRAIETGEFSPQQTIMRALIIALKTRTKVIVVESTAYQATLLYWFNFTAEQIGLTGIFFVPIQNTQTSKNARIMDAIRGVINNEQYIHGDIRSLVLGQITQWQPLKRDNDDGILDILAYAPKCVEMYQGLMMTEEEILIEGLASIPVLEGTSVF